MNNKPGKPKGAQKLFRSITKRTRSLFLRETVLFNSYDSLFRDLVKNAVTYAEYGCGQSTIWVAQNTSAQIHAVDTSKTWIAHVSQKIGASRAVLKWIDCGEIGEWGRPVDYAKAENFLTYADHFWQQAINPDVVLIDGRFRVLCFLRSLLQAKPGTMIIFDDYNHRPHYHIVEELIKPIEREGRVALFQIPEPAEIEKKKAEDLSLKFEYVME